MDAPRPRPADDAEQVARETRWLAQVAAGGAARSAGMHEIVKAYGRRFLRFLRARGLSVAHAEDVLQEVWLDIMNKAGEFEPGPPPSSWLWGFVGTARKDGVRQMMRGLRTVSDNDESYADEVGQAMALLTVPSPEAAHAQDQFRRCIHDALGEFRKRHANEAWLLHAQYLMAWSIEQVAACRRSSVGAARQFLHEARQKFKPWVRHCKDRHPD